MQASFVFGIGGRLYNGRKNLLGRSAAVTATPEYHHSRTETALGPCTRSGSIIGEPAYNVE